MGNFSSSEEESKPAEETSEVQVDKPQKVQFRLLGDEEHMPRLITLQQAEQFLPYLEYDYRIEWRMIYNNYSSYGSSIREFQRRVCHRGPTVVIVKDKLGAIFGCYASQSWEVKNRFYGDHKCFLFKFSESGEFERIEYSGRDHNYMYFNLGKESQPNGLGMGGSFERFALFMKDNFKEGVSYPGSLTFEKQPCLASKEKFELVDIEVLRVSLPSAEEDARVDEIMGHSKSALLNPENRALLDALDKPKHTAAAGVRAEELGGTADDQICLE